MGIRQVLGGLVAVLFLYGASARAQDGVWLQIEARPSQASAEERARDYAGRLPNVAGFRLRSGWFAIAIGPFPRDLAFGELSRLRSTGQVPRDSFITDGAGYGTTFWPPGGGIATSPVAVPEAPAAAPVGETVAEARAGERLLSRGEREEIQQALQTLGFYRGRIDGAFGAGTRRAMADWQAAFGHEPTGVLTTAQRRELTEGLREAIASLGMQRITDREAGIEISIPAAEVTFGGYEAPFARYAGDRIQVLLISQSGDADTLRGLYDVMQTLEIVPLEGAREIRRSSFTLTGANDQIVSHTYAALSDGAVKGFTLVWPAGDELRRTLAMERMRASFTPLDGAVLSDTAGGQAVQRPDLLAGLQIRQPDASVSGFYVDPRGAVVSAIEPLAACSRITLGGEVEADIAATAPDLGLALLVPREALAPLGIGRLSAAVPRLQAEIAVAGYSYGGVLGAPTISFGSLEDVRGLDGEESLERLALVAEPGDAGGPVLDSGGGVLGMLLPRQDDAKSLPPEVRFATDAAAIAGFLAENGIDLASVGEMPNLAPEDLALIGADMTVLVECWN